MRYYVVADVHGFFDELKVALTEKGFFEDTTPHKLVICGDLFDRGRQALLLQEFILDLLSKEEVILIKGNHEDLTLQLLNQWHRESYLLHHHHTNGTIDTVCQLIESTMLDIYDNPEYFGRELLKSCYIQEIIPAMLNYYETEHYIFTHGWIPCTPIETDTNETNYIYMEDWRNASEVSWNKARWINGMEAAHSGVIENGKTIVCGHWHCSFGHSRYEKDGGEFDNHPNFNPYYADGIIALDACTPISKKINCIVIDDEIGLLNL